MKKIHWLILVGVLVLIVMGLFLYQKATDDTYKGMTIIPEDHEDIPLFEGLEPREHNYVIGGDHWTEIYDFYLKELPKHGWNLEFEGSALDDGEPDNDWGGFHSGWRKNGFDGELYISSYYNQHEDQTEVKFDKTPRYSSTTWIQNIPESICVYQSLKDEACTKINDPTKIQQIAAFINDGIDWEEEVPHRENSGAIDFGDIKITVLYGNEIDLYFQSEKGTKMMKADPDFFELTNLSQ
ncbi:hypothetical protein [Mesobacillus jeotgali]|uniref:Uncharacterized protein n=1 Tax=Mesobacillus jeotgali TaxID=129985 RepID=A0ABY9VIN2_9BACI|nr:hypothetical protein [Mesobacillus jeotgali]WNF23523.1 hypothetical protein RH061_03145 [Mesobacillus jeotgali]